MLKKLLLSFLALAILCATASPVLAQGARGRGDRGPDKREIERIIKRLDSTTDSFKKAVDDTLDRSVLDGTRREDRINDRVSDFEKATDRLKDRFDRSDRWEETRGDVQNVLQEASTINGLFSRVRQYRSLQARWNMVKRDVNTLAAAYRLPRLR